MTCVPFIYDSSTFLCVLHTISPGNRYGFLRLLFYCHRFSVKNRAIRYGTSRWADSRKTCHWTTSWAVQSAFFFGLFICLLLLFVLLCYSFRSFSIVYIWKSWRWWHRFLRIDLVSFTLYTHIANGKTTKKFVYAWPASHWFDLMMGRAARVCVCLFYMLSPYGIPLFFTL